MDTMKLWNWIKDKYAKRRDERDDHDPWWVTLMLDLGRPAVAIMILIMCAPGEHYLGARAGFASLAWLTPATLTAYAGISAVVATKRPHGAPGRKTAVLGAILSILVAMAAQPVAHLYQQHIITGYQPALIIVVSVIPAAVFGHLLHMGAAVSKLRRSASPRKRGQADGQPAPKPAGQSMPLAPAPVQQSTTAASTPTGPVDGPSTAPKPIKTGLRAVARDLLSKDPSMTNDDLMAELLSTQPQSTYNTRWRSIARAREDLGIPA
jgi:hypothetical protein